MYGWGKEWYPVMAVESRRGRVWEDLWLADYRELPIGVHRGDKEKFRHENPDLQEWMVGRRNVMRVRRDGTEMKPVEISGPRIEDRKIGTDRKRRERDTERKSREMERKKNRRTQRTGEAEVIATQKKQKK